MAKWKSTLMNKEVRNPDGSIAQQGVTVWTPENDAAKADPRVEHAVQMGKYTPASPNEREEMGKRIKDKMRDDLKRKGVLPRDAR